MSFHTMMQGIGALPNSLLMNFNIIKKDLKVSTLIYPAPDVIVTSEQEISLRSSSPKIPIVAVLETALSTFGSFLMAYMSRKK